ncbi:MAG: hypothetical protein WCJ05_00860 [bacterium]
MSEVSNNQIMDFISQQILFLESSEVIIESSDQDIVLKSVEKAILIGQMSVLSDLAKFVMNIMHDTDN